MIVHNRKVNSSNFQNQAYLEEKCALNELLNLLSKRWMTDVLFSIEEGNNRFSSIRDDLKYISDNILADRIKLLEQHKLIRKKTSHETPPRVEYTLTKTGEELSNLLEGLCNFAERMEL
jgi:DNA-binding HxlR family transcriptional regulator